MAPFQNQFTNSEIFISYTYLAAKQRWDATAKYFNFLEHSSFYYVPPVFTNHNLRTLGTQSIAALYMTPRTGSIYFPNRLLFVTRIGCVYYEVQTQFLNNV